MNKSNVNNYYLYNQTTREKTRRSVEKNNGLITGRKNIFGYKNNNYSKSPIAQTYHKNESCNNIFKGKENEKKIIKKSTDKKNNGYFYSIINIKDITLNNKSKYNNNQNRYNNISKEKEPSNHDNNNNYTKNKYQRCNSIAYIKKRPNDLMKSQHLDTNMVNNKYIINSSKIKGRCLSCTNIKKSFNILNNDIDDNNISPSKKSFLPISYQYVPNNYIKEQKINSFSVKKYSKTLNNKNIICYNIFNVIRTYLLSYKNLFFKKIKFLRNINMYEVSLEEYRFLEELKALGVTNKKELNSLLKDIYISIKGNDEKNNQKNKK